VSEGDPRPAEVCRHLLSALGATEGRRARRKRDTAPDALGLEIERALLEATIAADPAPDEFADWLLAQAETGAARSLALLILDEWRFALASPAFRAWLASGAPSADRSGERTVPR
jgi:hypothetical protein